MFGKDVMETCGGEYGFICVLAKMHCMKEVTGWINVSCAMGITLFTMFWFFLFVVKRKERKGRECKVSHLLYYCSWCDLFLEMVCIKKCND